MKLKIRLQNKNRRLQLLLGLALLSEFAYLAIASVEDLRNHVPFFLACYGLAFLLYWLAAVHFFGLSSTTEEGGANLLPASALRWLKDFAARLNVNLNMATREILTIGILFGALFRLTFLFTQPTLSDDIYRYVWDGKVAANGINPYQHEPEAEALQPLRDSDIYPFVNHKEIPTVYPPVSQLTFLGLYAIKGSVLTFKAGLLLFEALMVFVLAFILKSLQINQTRLLIYLWNPLPIVEIAGSGHADIIGVFFLVAALYLMTQKKWVGATVLLAFSFLTKFIAVILLPVLTLVKKRRKIVIPLVFLIVVVLFYLPYADVGAQLFSGLSTYSAKWEFNGSAFPLISHLLEKTVPEQWVVKWMIQPFGMTRTPETLITRTHDLASAVTKGLIAIFFAAVALYYFRRLSDDLRAGGEIWFFRLTVLLYGAFLILNATVHPWYLCWIVPLLAVAPNRAWLLLTGLIALSYWVLVDYARTGIWQESLAIKYLEYLPFYTLLILDAVRTKYGKPAEPL